MYVMPCIEQLGMATALGEVQVPVTAKHHVYQGTEREKGKSRNPNCARY